MKKLNYLLDIDNFLYYFKKSKNLLKKSANLIMYHFWIFTNLLLSELANLLMLCFLI